MSACGRGQLFCRLCCHVVGGANPHLGNEFDAVAEYVPNKGINMGWLACSGHALGPLEKTRGFGMA